MEPRTHARGNEIEMAGDGWVVIASMEPRTHARGNLPKRLSTGYAYPLQWSHALTRVET